MQDSCRFTQVPQVLALVFGVSSECAVQSQMFVSGLERLECCIVRDVCVMYMTNNATYKVSHLQSNWGLFCEGMCALSQQQVHINIDLKHLLVNEIMSNIDLFNA